MITRRSQRTELTFINLIDVMLVLLIIFMMAAPTIQNWVDVNLPAVQQSQAKITEGIVITLTKDGAVYIDRDKITLGDFEQHFTELWGTREGEPVFVRADAEVPYGDVVAVIGTVRKLGGENVGLVVTDERNGD